MKKKLFLLLFLFAFFSFKIVYASPITYSRTSDDLRLPKNVDVGAVNVDEVMKIPAVDSKAKIYDFYGPTETTVYSTYKNVTKSKFINIGKPILNTTIHILDTNNK